MTRSERQELCVDNWIRAGGRAAIVGSTGFGKTRVAILAIKRVLTKYPDFKTLVVVPSTNLKDQWEENLRQWNLEKIFSKETYLLDIVPDEARQHILHVK